VIQSLQRPRGLLHRGGRVATQAEHEAYRFRLVLGRDDLVPPIRRSYEGAATESGKLCA